jgi:hypothetical protein
MCLSFRGRWIHPSKHGHWNDLFGGNCVTNKVANNGMAMLRLRFGKKGGFKFILSNHCNVVGHDEVLDVEVGRNEIVRGC